MLVIYVIIYYIIYDISVNIYRYIIHVYDNFGPHCDTGNQNVADSKLAKLW
jgi:hypothetical protein